MCFNNLAQRFGTALAEIATVCRICCESLHQRSLTGIAHRCPAFRQLLIGATDAAGVIWFGVMDAVDVLLWDSRWLGSSAYDSAVNHRVLQPSAVSAKDLDNCLLTVHDRHKLPSCSNAKAFTGDHL